MSIPEDKIDKIRSFGYTEVEARFLYLVATHSGYFTLRQFLDFAHAKSGKRNARLVEKLFGLGHASARRYNRRSLVFQLRSRQIYSAIGKNHLRNRQEHELLHIKTRLLALNPHYHPPSNNGRIADWRDPRLAMGTSGPASGYVACGRNLLQGSLRFTEDASEQARSSVGSRGCT